MNLSITAINNITREIVNVTLKSFTKEHEDFIKNHKIISQKIVK